MQHIQEIQKDYSNWIILSSSLPEWSRDIFHWKQFIKNWTWNPLSQFQPLAHEPGYHGQEKLVACKNMTKRPVYVISFNIIFFSKDHYLVC